MEEFSKNLNKRKKIYSSVLVFTILLYIGVLLYELLENDKNDDVMFYLGVISGLSIVMALNAMIYIRKINQASKNKDFLQKLYIEEFDERKKFIELKSCKMMINIFVYTLFVIMLIMFMINEVIAWTLFGCVCVMTIIKYLTTYYYNKKI